MRTPVSAQALPQLAIEKAESDSFNTRKIFTALPADPFLFVHHKFKAGADALREETARRMSGVVPEDEDKPLVDLASESSAPVQVAPAEPSTPTVVAGKPAEAGAEKPLEAKKPEAPVKVALPANDIIKPGTPVAINSTLQGALQAKQAELEASKAPVVAPVELPVAVAPVAEPTAPAKAEPTVVASTGGLQLGLPTGGSPSKVAVVPEDGADLQVPDAQAYGLVPFEVLNPTTWRPAYDAYLAPHVSTNLALGLGLAFVVVAFVLGRAAASSPLKKSK